MGEVRIRPTSLELHDFPEESFINGCYIPISICDKLIKYFDENPERQAKGNIYSNFNNTDSNLEIKDSLDISFAATTNEEDARILSEYIQYLQLCDREYEHKYSQIQHMSYGLVENIQIQKYEPNQGFKTWHCERSGIRQQTRCLAFMTYLNDVPDGGTEFMYQKLTSPAKKGLTMIWPSDWTHVHKGQISKQHTKYIITGWLNYKT